VRETLEAVTVADRRSSEDRRTDDRAAAFTRLADAHLDASYRLARAILRNPSEAQDATHDAYVQAWRKWDTLRDPERFEAWFDRILVNICRNRLQRSTRWQATDISDELSLSSGDSFAQAHDRDLVGAAILGLPPEHRIVIALRFYRDLTVDEIARRLAVPAGTVQSRLHYALKRLHDAIDPQGSEGATR
jgi:RNA polymerase sigma-70 factor (ECF subfamily)